MDMLIYFDKETRSFSLAPRNYIGIGIGSGVGALGGGVLGYRSAKNHLHKSGLSNESEGYKRLIKNRIIKGSIMGGALGGAAGFGASKMNNPFKKFGKLNSPKGIKIDPNLTRVRSGSPVNREEVFEKNGVRIHWENPPEFSEAKLMGGITKKYSASKFLLGKGGRVATRGLQVAGLALGAASAGIGLKKALDDRRKFGVVFVTREGPKQVTVKGHNKVAAIEKTRGNHPGATSIRAFELPNEDDAMTDYYQGLKR